MSNNADKGEQTMSEKIDYKEVMTRMKMDVNYIAEEAYNKGYEQAKLIWSSKADEKSYQRGLSEGNDIGYKDGVNDGRNEAWEAARKIVLSPDEGGTSLTDIYLMFGNNGSMQRIFRSYSATEVIEKLKAYEKKQKVDDEIKVGDVVERYINDKFDSTGIFLGEDGNYWNCLFWAGAGFITFAYPKNQFKKTGIHLGIDKIMEEMKNE